MTKITYTTTHTFTIMFFFSTENILDKSYHYIYSDNDSHLLHMFPDDQLQHTTKLQLISNRRKWITKIINYI